MKVYRLDRETLQRGLDPCSLTCFQIFTIRSIPPAITSTSRKTHRFYTQLDKWNVTP